MIISSNMASTTKKSTKKRDRSAAPKADNNKRASYKAHQTLVDQYQEELNKTVTGGGDPQKVANMRENIRALKLDQDVIDLPTDAVFNDIRNGLAKPTMIRNLTMAEAVAQWNNVTESQKNLYDGIVVSNPVVISRVRGYFVSMSAYYVGYCIGPIIQVLGLITLTHKDWIRFLTSIKLKSTVEKAEMLPTNKVIMQHIKVDKKWMRQMEMLLNIEWNIRSILQLKTDILEYISNVSLIREMRKFSNPWTNGDRIRRLYSFTNLLIPGVVPVLVKVTIKVMGDIAWNLSNAKNPNMNYVRRSMDKLNYAWRNTNGYQEIGKCIKRYNTIDGAHTFAKGCRKSFGILDIVLSMAFSGTFTYYGERFEIRRDNIQPKDHGNQVFNNTPTIGLEVAKVKNRNGITRTQNRIEIVSTIEQLANYLKKKRDASLKARTKAEMAKTKKQITEIATKKIKPKKKRSNDQEAGNKTKKSKKNESNIVDNNADQDIKKAQRALNKLHKVCLKVAFDLGTALNITGLQDEVTVNTVQPTAMNVTQ